MPLYTFACSKCKNIFEALCRIKNPTIVTCPSCGSEDLQRQMHLEGSVSVTFKNPKGTSREDNLDYVYRWNVDNAKKTREMAQEYHKQQGTEPITYDKYLQNTAAPDYDPAHPDDVIVGGEREYV